MNGGLIVRGQQAAAAIRFVLLALTAGGVAMSVAAQLYLVAGAMAIVGLGVWVMIPRRRDELPVQHVAFLVVFTFSSLLPTAVNLPIQALALIWGYIAWFHTPKSSHRGGRVVGWATAVLVFWALLMIHPNVPDLSVGLLGFRKTALAVAGLVYGCAIAERHRWAAERFIIWALTAAMGVSIVAHLWFPSIEQLVASRDAADLYTGLYDGEARLQGVFAGPFHAAACGVLLVGWALVRWRSSFWLPKAALLLGAAGTYLTMVRTAFVAVGLVVLVLVFLSTSFGKFMKRALLVAVLGGVGLFSAIAADAPVLDLIGSIADFSTDSRFQNRIPGYDDGLQMFSDSPIWGWGAGSAGDTLGAAMAPGLHVTAHNLLLKIAVEGGLIGVILWCVLIIAVWHAVKPRTPSGRMAMAAIAGLVGMGLTGSAIETLPVSYLLFALVGLAVTPAPASPKPHTSASTSPYGMTATPFVTR